MVVVNPLLNHLVFSLVVLTEKKCTLFAAPQNGALACVKFGDDRACAAMCKSEFDFSTAPALIYICHSGTWIPLSLLPGTTDVTPPADCSGEINTKNNLNK